jgi:hypothetical protein
MRSDESSSPDRAPQAQVEHQQKAPDMTRPRTLAALALAAVSVGAGSAAWAGPPARKPAQAPASALPTPNQAFALVHYRFDDADWFERMHGEQVVRMRTGFALLMRGEAHDCDACNAVMSVTYFHRRQGRWIAARTWDQIFEGSSSAGVFGIEPIMLGLANPTLKLSWGDGRDGWDDGYVSILELTPSRPILHADQVVAGGDNTGATDDPKEGCWVHATIRPLRGRPGMVIRYWGHQAHWKKVARTVRYFGRGDRWTAHPRAFTVMCVEKSFN